MRARMSYMAYPARTRSTTHITITTNTNTHNTTFAMVSSRAAHLRARDGPNPTIRDVQPTAPFPPPTRCEERWRNERGARQSLCEERRARNLADACFRRPVCAERNGGWRKIKRIESNARFTQASRARTHRGFVGGFLIFAVHIFPRVARFVIFSQVRHRARTRSFARAFAVPRIHLRVLHGAPCVRKTHTKCTTTRCTVGHTDSKQFSSMRDDGDRLGAQL